MTDLPEELDGHCLLTLGNGDLFLVGGYSMNVANTSYHYSMQDEQWSQKADMIQARHRFGCGRVTNPTTGKEEVLVTAGWGNDFEQLSTTEIYTAEDDSWRSGKPLPMALSKPASLQYEDTLLILGGGNEHGCLDKIYEVIFKSCYCYLDCYNSGMSTI